MKRIITAAALSISFAIGVSAPQPAQAFILSLFWPSVAHAPTGFEGGIQKHAIFADIY